MWTSMFVEEITENIINNGWGEDNKETYREIRFLHFTQTGKMLALVDPVMICTLIVMVVTEV